MHIHFATTGNMGDNERSSSDPCESGYLVLRTERTPLDCLQRFLRGLREGRRLKDMDHLALCLTEYTQEIAAGVVDVFRFCFSKGIKWKQLIVRLAVPEQNRFLHLILSEARILHQFKEVDLMCPWAVALTNEFAMELHAMMSSEQGLERLRLSNSMQLLPGVLSNGTLSNLILALVGHPMLEKLRLYRSDGLDHSTRALCSLLDSGSCMLSTLSFELQSNSSLKIDVGPLAEAIERYGGIRYLNLSHNRLDIRDLATLLDAASRCKTLVSLNVSYNNIGNLELLDGIMQTHTPSRLRRLDLRGNPLGDDDRAALAKLVKDHPELQDFGFSEEEEALLITPDLQYILDFNRSGRVLLTKPSTPLSIWATVLERANSLFENDSMFATDEDRDTGPERRASVIYSLLQGPAFVARLRNH
jgi:hypothetical protein